MKCTKCGYENREGARFCKGCGEALQAPRTAPMGPAAPPKPAGIVCPVCGAVTDRADARYCLRCGKPFPGLEPAPPPAPARPAARPPAPPPAAAKDAETERSLRGQPPAPPPKSKKGLPQWVLWVAMGFCGLMCLVTLLTIAAFTIPRLAGAEPSPTPTVVPTAEPTDVPPPATQGALVENPTEIPTESPTATSSPTPSPEPTLTPPAPASPTATVTIKLSSDTLRPGELLTVTVSMTNTGQRAFEGARCHLVWDGPLASERPLVKLIGGRIEPGQTGEVATFVLRAVGVGEAGVQASVTARIPGEELPWAAMSVRGRIEILE